MTIHGYKKIARARSAPACVKSVRAQRPQVSDGRSDFEKSVRRSAVPKSTAPWRVPGSICPLPRARIHPHPRSFNLLHIRNRKTTPALFAKFS